MFLFYFFSRFSASVRANLYTQKVIASYLSRRPQVHDALRRYIIGISHTVVGFPRRIFFFFFVGHTVKFRRPRFVTTAPRRRPAPAVVVVAFSTIYTTRVPVYIYTVAWPRGARTPTPSVFTDIFKKQKKTTTYIHRVSLGTNMNNIIIVRDQNIPIGAYIIQYQRENVPN